MTVYYYPTLITPSCLPYQQQNHGNSLNCLPLPIDSVENINQFSPFDPQRWKFQNDEYEARTIENRTTNASENVLNIEKSTSAASYKRKFVLELGSFETSKRPRLNFSEKVKPSIFSRNDGTSLPLNQSFQELPTPTIAKELLDAVEVCEQYSKILDEVLGILKYKIVNSETSTELEKIALQVKNIVCIKYASNEVKQQLRIAFNSLAKKMMNNLNKEGLAPIDKSKLLEKIELYYSFALEFASDDFERVHDRLDMVYFFTSQGNALKELEQWKSIAILPKGGYAYNSIGILYLYGAEGIPINYNLALENFNRGAEKGDFEADYNIAVTYDLMRLGNKNNQKQYLKKCAITHYKKISEYPARDDSKLAIAYFNYIFLSQINCDGNFSPKKTSEVKSLFEEAAKRNPNDCRIPMTQAIIAFLDIPRNKNRDIHNNGKIGGKKNIQILNYLMKARDLGSALAKEVLKKGQYANELIKLLRELSLDPYSIYMEK